jgi:hypothetical protein
VAIRHVLFVFVRVEGVQGGVEDSGETGFHIFGGFSSIFRGGAIVPYEVYTSHKKVPDIGRGI